MCTTFRLAMVAVVGLMTMRVVVLLTLHRLLLSMLFRLFRVALSGTYCCLSVCSRLRQRLL